MQVPFKLYLGLTPRISRPGMWPPPSSSGGPAVVDGCVNLHKSRYLVSSQLEHAHASEMQHGILHGGQHVQTVNSATIHYRSCSSERVCQPTHEQTLGVTRCQLEGCTCRLDLDLYLGMAATCTQICNGLQPGASRLL